MIFFKPGWNFLGVNFPRVELSGVEFLRVKFSGHHLSMHSPSEWNPWTGWALGWRSGLTGSNPFQERLQVLDCGNSPRGVVPSKRRDREPKSPGARDVLWGWTVKPEDIPLDHLV